jgi:nitroimidazol reductase NimA-like FMN-containing flavoprotein (pyridoxamine 5'-phosphate oxidase superfamily)
MDAAPAGLTFEVCLELLATKSLGRVAYTDRAMPAVLPVNYALDGHRIVLRTRDGGVLARQMNNAIVAFEVDDVDDGMRSGWSVLVTGVARLIKAPADLLRWERLCLFPYAAGEGHQLVTITPGRVTGRRVGAFLAG